MSIDHCRKCGDRVDTDFDVDCYEDNQPCMCERCRKPEEDNT